MKGQNKMALPQGALAQLAAINPDGKPRIIECDDEDYLIVVQKSSGVYVVEQTDPDKMKVLLHADDSAGDPQTLLVDGNKSLQVGQFSGDEWAIKQQTPSDMMIAQHHFDGVNWRKSNMLWGYNGQVSETVFELNATAGTFTLTSTVVPSGEVHVIQALSAQNQNTDPTLIMIYATCGSDTPRIKSQATPGIAIPIVWTGNVTLIEGDTLSAQFRGCTLNDDLYFWILGYKMKVNM